MLSLFQEPELFKAQMTSAGHYTVMSSLPAANQVWLQSPEVAVYAYAKSV